MDLEISQSFVFFKSSKVALCFDEKVILKVADAMTIFWLTTTEKGIQSLTKGLDKREMFGVQTT